MHLATKHAAMLGLIHKEEQNKEGPEEPIQLSAQDLNDFLLERAAANPRCAAMLQQMRFYEVVVMLQRAEKDRDVQMYLSGTKLSQLLFANTNAFNYVYMVFNLMIHSYCSSEAELKVLEKILFRKTKGGKFIYMDRSVEWSMRLIRTFLGKFYNSATDGRFCSVVAQLNRNEGMGRKSSTQATLNNPNATDNVAGEEKVEFSRIYLEVLVYQEDSRMWYHDEKQVEVKSKGYKERGESEGNDPLPEDLLSSMSDKSVMHSDVLFSITTAKSRLKLYFEELKEGATKFDTKFPSPPTSKVDMVELDKILRSTSASDLKVRFYTIMMLKEEIVRHCLKLELEVPTFDRPKKVKNDLVEMVILYRLLRVDKLSQGKTAAQGLSEWNRISVAEHHIANNSSPQDSTVLERLKEELKEQFYTLGGTNSSDKKFTVPVKYILRNNDSDSNARDSGDDDESAGREENIIMEDEFDECDGMPDSQFTIDSALS